MSGSSAAYESRGRTMNPPEEKKDGRRGGRDESNDADTSLAREKSRSQGMKSYTVPDGEFASFPEIHATTA